MTKKKGIFDVDADISLFKQGKGTDLQEKLLGEKETASSKKTGRHLGNVMETIIQQMIVRGYRERTITDYVRYMAQFRKVANVEQGSSIIPLLYRLSIKHI